MRDSELQDAIFRESVRQLERSKTSLGTGKSNPQYSKRSRNIPQFIVERKAVGSTTWKAFSAHFNRKKAEQSIPDNNDHYEYRIRNGSHTA